MPILALIFMGSCSSDEDFYYQDTARVRLVGPEVWTVGSDSLTFSFVSYAAEITQQVMPVDVQIMGNAVNHDRIANIIVDPALTTASASQFSVPATVLIPADSTHAFLPVTLHRDASLQSNSVRLRIIVAESSDFAVGVNEENHLTFIWNDKLAKPSNWNDLKEFFGVYSDGKYRFMLENATPGTTFNIETMSWALLMSYKIKFQNALRLYNDAHPGQPFTDENGNLVTFD